MRSFYLGFIGVSVALVAACGGLDGEDPDVSAAACGTAEAVPECVPGGLDGIALAGTWQVTGTRTVSSSSHPGPPTTSSVAYSETLEVDGCKLIAGTMIGTRNDTTASANTYDALGSHSLSLCATADGTLAYHFVESWDRRARGGDNGSATTTGTLTR